MDQLPPRSSPILSSSMGMTHVPINPVTTQTPRMIAMNPSSHPRAALMYAMNVPSATYQRQRTAAEVAGNIPYDKVVRKITARATEPDESANRRLARAEALLMKMGIRMNSDQSRHSSWQKDARRCCTPTGGDDGCASESNCVYSEVD